MQQDNTLLDDGTTPIITPANNIPLPTDTPSEKPFMAKPIVKYAALAGAGIGIAALTMSFTADAPLEPIAPDAHKEPTVTNASAAPLATDAILTDSPENQAAHSDPNHGLHQAQPLTIHEHADLATTVSDELSFGDAFHAARAEQGAGGVFEWHGQYYNTYNKEEWAAMSDEQKEEYASSIDHLPEPHNYQPLPAALAEHEMPVHYEPVIVPHDTHNTINAADTIHLDVPQEPIIITDVHTEHIDTDALHTVTLDTHMPEMPNDLVEIPLEDNMTGSVHFSNDGQPDAIYIDQDHNHIPEMIILPDHNDPTHSTYMLDENQDHIIEDQGAHQEHTETTETNQGYHTEMTETNQDYEHPIVYDEPTYDHTPIADFDNNTDMHQWG